MTCDEIMKILAKAKECGVERVHIEGLEVSFFCSHELPKQEIKAPWVEAFVPKEPTNPPSPSPAMIKVEDIYKQVAALDEMSPEEILFAATPYAYELKAMKAEREAQLKEEQLHEQED